MPNTIKMQIPPAKANDLMSSKNIKTPKAQIRLFLFSLPVPMHELDQV
jgi:hypothetical protein